MLYPPLMPRLRPIVSSLAALALLLGARVAGAQTATISLKTSLPRYESDGTTPVKKRQVNPEVINFSDCFDDQLIDLTVTTSGANPAADTLQVWAGTQDCKPVAARSGTTQQCWRVAGNLPLSATTNVKIPVRTLVRRNTSGDSVGDYSKDPSVCNDISLTTYSLFLLWLRGAGTEPVGTGDQVDIQVKTVRPGALTGVQVLPGNTRLIVTWASTGEAGAVDQAGVRVYCDPQISLSSADTKEETVCPDASTDASDGSGDASDLDASVDSGCFTRTVSVPGTGGACGSQNLVSKTSDGGTPALPDKKYVCAELGGGTSTRAVVETFDGKPLVNETKYAVALAATDSFGNVGSLGTPTCASPGETSDFWQLYRNSGGQAGGCALDGGGAPMGSMAFAGSLLGIGLSVARRRWRKRS